MTLSEDRTLKVWNIEGRWEHFTFTGHECFALLADGIRVISGLSNGAILLWNSRTGRELQRMTGHVSKVRCVAATPNSSCAVSVSEDGALKCWDLSNGTERYEVIEAHEPRLKSLTVIHKGDYVVSEGYGFTVRIIDLRTGVLHLSFNDYNCFSVAPDEMSLLVGFADGTIAVWALKERVPRMQIKAHNSAIEAILTTPDSLRYITMSADGSIAAWDSATGAELFRLREPGHKLRLKALVLNGLSILCTVTPEVPSVALNRQDIFSVWDCSDGTKQLSFKTYGYLDSMIYAAGFPVVLPDSNIVTGTADGKLRIWDLSSKSSYLPVADEQHESRVQRIAFTPDCTRVVSMSEEGTIHVSDFASGRKQLTLHGKVAEKDNNSRSFPVLEIVDNNRVLSNQGTAKVTVWDLTTGAALLSLPSSFNEIARMPVSRDGTRLIAGSQVWDLAASTQIASLAEASQWKAAGGRIGDVALTANGRNAVVGFSTGIAVVWDVIRLEVSFLSWLHGSGITSLTMTPDDRYAISGSSDGSLVVWSLAGPEKGLKRFSLTKHRAAIRNILVGSDGTRFLSLDAEGVCNVWNLRNGEFEGSLAGITSAIGGQTLSVDGREVFATSAGSTLSLWDLDRREVVATFTADEEISSVGIGLDRATIALGDVSGALHFLIAQP